MKKRKIRFLAPILILLLAISNIPLVSIMIGIVTGTESMHTENPQFSSEEGGFRTSGEYLSGGTAQGKYETLLREFEVYKIKNSQDTVLYRHFGFHPIRFWTWYRSWLNRDNPFFQLPYKPPPKEQ